MDTTHLKSFLEHTKVKDIAKMNDLISMKSTDTIEQTLATLALNEITGAPVFDAGTHKFIGFVDVLDLATFIANVFADNYKKHPHLYDPKELAQRFGMSVVEVINASARDPFLPVDINASVEFLMNNFLRYGIHRVALQDGDKIVGLVSQSDVVRFFSQHPNNLVNERKKTLEELGLAKGNVVSVSYEDTLIKAFVTLLTHKITGLAVVDAHGRLVNNLSASDLKGLTKENFWKLEIQIHQMLLSMGTKLPPVVVSPNATLGEVMDKFQKFGIHRIFVVDEESKPVNVISLTDVLNVFVTPFHLPAK